MQLGIDLISAAASFLPAVFGPDGAGAPGVMPAPGAPGTPVSPQGGVRAEISPAIQTRVSPQISPVFTQIQSSPGAGVMASPQQAAPGGPVPQYGYSPSPYAPSAIPSALRSTRGLEGINWTPIALTAIAGIAVLGLMRQRRKRPK